MPLCLAAWRCWRKRWRSWRRARRGSIISISRPPRHDFHKLDGGLRVLLQVPAGEDHRGLEAPPIYQQQVCDDCAGLLWRLPNLQQLLDQKLALCREVALSRLAFRGQVDGPVCHRAPFPGYPKENIRFKCNEHKVKGIQINYKSAAKYVGSDELELLVLFPAGTAWEVHYDISVR